MRFSSLVAALFLHIALIGAAQASDTPATGANVPGAKAAVKRPTAKPAAAKSAAAKKGKFAPVVAPIKTTLVAPSHDILNEHFAVTVSGNVTNAAGAPLPGATVWVTGKSRDVLAVTNAAGQFSLTLPSNAPIALSCGYAGYENQQISLRQPKAQTSVSVRLDPLPLAKHR
ncbi:carboxypeptidase regulatory-like domain-containing protein [Hymenobacter koreensis]|uniref:Carboxypeptidase-like regulatory domain-containing protein n=1 Tax=Hymenobacter koreensis TaxID=1084523 RepID=A0ABP8IV93_9BACT